MNEHLDKNTAIMKEQLSWIAKELSDIKRDLKALKESHYLFMGKVLGASAVIAVIASVLVEVLRR
jgi:hypothetical protein